MASGGMAARRNHREPKWEAIARPVGPHDTTPAVRYSVGAVAQGTGRSRPRSGRTMCVCEGSVFSVVINVHLGAPVGN